MQRKVYTTGQVARMLGVAPKTVLGWCAGDMPHWRLPGGSRDRRIPHAKLIAWLVAKGVPLPPELQQRTLLVCPTVALQNAYGHRADAATSVLDVGRKLDASYGCVIIDAVGTSDRYEVVQAARELPNCHIVVILPDDVSDSAGADIVLRHPVTESMLVNACSGAVK